MTSLLTVISLAGVLAGSLCPGTIAPPSRTMPRNLQPMAISHKEEARSSASTGVRRADSQQAGSVELGPIFLRRSEQPVVIIVYGEKPWSWM